MLWFSLIQDNAVVIQSEFRLVSVSMNLPDTASEIDASFDPIRLVGMEEVYVPIVVQDQTVPANLNLKVSLDSKQARGIHMSRLYSEMQKQIQGKVFTKKNWETFLQSALATQNGLSHNLLAQISWQFALSKEALVTAEAKSVFAYPIAILSNLVTDPSAAVPKFSHQLRLELVYSSTCPASAALARNRIANFVRDAIAKNQTSLEGLADLLEENSIATPHAQRSKATIRVLLASGQDDWLNLIPVLIQKVELALGTPVQGLVKRADEQEFAARNAQNLMYCEDAVRRMARALIAEGFNSSEFAVKAEHFESLHAHNAVAETGSLVTLA
jgi:GTP cyclohydrolase I